MTAKTLTCGSGHEPLQLWRIRGALLCPICDRTGSDITVPPEPSDWRADQAAAAKVAVWAVLAVLAAVLAAAVSAATLAGWI